MKIIKHLNTFAIGLPILIFATYPVYKENSIFCALYSTMVTGFIQVILSIFLLIRNPKDKFMLIYLAAVVLFFSFWYFNIHVFYSDYLTFFLFPIPLILAIYLSYLIYNNPKP